MLTRNQLVKQLWRELSTDPPMRDSTCGILVWREDSQWAEGWGMQGWGQYFSAPAKMITFRKSCRHSMVQCLVDAARKMTHWIYLPLPEEQHTNIDLVALRDRLWIHADQRLPPIATKGGYVLCNAHSNKVIVVTGVSVQNIIKCNTVTGKNRIKYWMPLVGPYDTI